jgi:hypothetical protein
LITLLPEGEEVPAAIDADATAVIQPSTAWLKGGAKQPFRVPIVWEIDPAGGPGKIGAESGEYLAMSIVRDVLHFIM